MLITKTVEVTQKDIYTGLRSDCKNCPVALAITRATGQAADVNTAYWSFKSQILNSRNWHELPHDACKFVNDFDAFRPVAPFSFPITYEEPAVTA